MPSDIAVNRYGITKRGDAIAAMGGYKLGRDLAVGLDPDRALAIAAYLALLVDDPDRFSQIVHELAMSADGFRRETADGRETADATGDSG